MYVVWNRHDFVIYGDNVDDIVLVHWLFMTNIKVLWYIYYVCQKLICFGPLMLFWSSVNIYVNIIVFVYSLFMPKNEVFFFSVYYLCQIFICFGPIIIYAKYHIIDLVHNFAFFALLIILFIWKKKHFIILLFFIVLLHLRELYISFLHTRTPVFTPGY